MSTGIAAGATISPANFRGMVFPYAAATAPTGFLLCDGAAVSRTTYADLFTLIGTTYGAGDGATTFNVPNLRGRVIVGYSATAPTKTFTFASRSGDTITVTGSDNHANNEIQTGQAVLYDTSSGAIGGLVDNTTYYLIRIAHNQFKLATSVANANAGTAITLSSDGSGVQTFAITYTARPLGQSGGEENHALTDAQLPSHNHSGAYSTTTSGAGFPTIIDDGNTNNGSINTVEGSDTPHNIMPLFAVLNYIIKT
jgi:microcystin-dependent protein